MERSREEGDDRYLLYPPSRSDQRYHSRDHLRRVGGEDRRGEERRSEEYRGNDSRRGGRRGRDDMYQRQSISPRPGEVTRLERRGELKATSRGDREGYSDRRDRSDLQKASNKMRHDREQIERKHRRRKRSRSSRLEEKEHERRTREKVRESSLVSGESEQRVSPRGDKIEDWIKELEGDNESESQQDRHGNESDASSFSGESGSSEEDDDVKNSHRKLREERGDRESGASDSEKSEEGEIIDENESSEDESLKEEGESGQTASHGEFSRSATEPILRSKFDDSSGSTSEGEDNLKTKIKKGCSFIQRPQLAYSGYADVVSGSDHSDVETDEKTHVVTSGDIDREVDGEEEDKRVDTTGEEDNIQQKQEDGIEEENEEEEDGISNLPPYLPALMGCRNVEEYEWLNRIEEGTYGVVYRAKDKRSGETYLSTLEHLYQGMSEQGTPPCCFLRKTSLLAFPTFFDHLLCVFSI